MYIASGNLAKNKDYWETMAIEQCIILNFGQVFGMYANTDKMVHLIFIVSY